MVRKGRHFFILSGLSLLLAGCAAMLLGGIAQISLLLWLPYCLAVIGQAMNYPVSLAIATENAPVDGPYAMALCGFMHQLMAAAIGAIAGTLAGQPIWLCAGLMCLLALAAFSALARSRQPSIAPI
ncbi:hypothetical protein [Chromobacterium paludis]|uniref:hypothetical protein n=1 Tax=Chromobacterium paludis TaxID=2605945 RepID=UPI0018C8BF20|nr:hypothetical protein [Chromobacterium paludis]